MSCFFYNCSSLPPPPTPGQNIRARALELGMPQWQAALWVTFLLEEPTTPCKGGGQQPPEVLLAGLSWHGTTASTAGARTVWVPTFSSHLSQGQVPSLQMGAGQNREAPHLLTILAKTKPQQLVARGLETWSSCSSQEENPPLGAGLVATAVWSRGFTLQRERAVFFQIPQTLNFLPNLQRFSHDVSSFTVWT